MRICADTCGQSRAVAETGGQSQVPAAQGEPMAWKMQQSWRRLSLVEECWRCGSTGSRERDILPTHCHGPAQAEFPTASAVHEGQCEANPLLIAGLGVRRLCATHVQPHPSMDVHGLAQDTADGNVTDTALASGCLDSIYCHHGVRCGATRTVSRGTAGPRRSKLKLPRHWRHDREKRSFWY